MRTLLILLVSLMIAAPLSGGAPGEDGPPGASPSSASRAGGGMLVQVDSLSAVVEVPPQQTRVLRVDHGNATLVPVDWEDPVEAASSLHRRAVDRVEPWLRRDLAVQLGRLGTNGNRYANLVIDCPDARWVDEIAFTVAHTPPEVLTQVPNVKVLQDNARHLYEQDADLQYADLVERSGADGNYTTVSYLNLTGARHEYPRDVYYFYVAHARVFWEDPAKVSGRSFWRKAYWDEIQYEDSGTLESRLTGATNIIEAANASSVWMQMNMEFGYGTNPLQPVQVVLERYGSCGQFSITTAAALKVAMIPARVAIYPASDHQWNEVFIDGHWMLLDASNDVAGDTRVKEPELIRRTNAVRFNDAGVFERGWKPYMSAMSTFRSDDVIINSIDISAPDPSFTFRESGMTRNSIAEPHMYTETSTVTINVVDPGGDPVEGAWVGVFRVGHDIYDPGTTDHPHFAYANYTNATGQAEFQLGLQGYCSRCDADHYYAALILSRYNQATNDFYAFSVPEENREYSLTYTVTGDASPQVEPAWTEKDLVGAPPEPAGDFLLNVSLETWGRQRHVHGEYGQYEVFGFRTSFDHQFPSDVDLLVVDGEGLRHYRDGNLTPAWFGATDAERLEEGDWIPSDEDVYLLLSNTDCHYTTKVVNVTVDLSAMCRPRLVMDGPGRDTDHSTAVPLVFNGTLWDYIPITGLDVSLDGGDTWEDLHHGYDATNGTYEAEVNVSDLESGDHHLLLRATNEVGVETREYVTVFLDADDPWLEIVTPVDGAIRSGLDESVDVGVNASDDRELSRVEARWEDGSWQPMVAAELPGRTHDLALGIGDRVGSVMLQVRVTDGVGRTTVAQVEQVLDVLLPTLELVDPEAGDREVVGPGWEVTVTGSVWDDLGIHSLTAWVDDGEGLSVEERIGEGGSFSFSIPTDGLEEGEHTVTVTVEDMATHQASKTFDLVIDGTAPVLTLDQLDPYYDDGDDVDLSGTVTDEHGVQGLWVAVDGGDEEQLFLDLAGGFLMALPSGSEAVGGHQLTVRALDALGNEALVITGYQVLDETDPSLTIDTPRSGADIGRGNPVHLSGTADDNVAVTVLALRVGVEDTRYVLENLDPVMGQWSIDIATAGRDLGQVLIEVRVEDAAGNMAVRSVVVDIVDRTDPTLHLTGDAMPKAQRGKVLEVSASFSDDVGVTKLEYRVDGWSWIAVPCGFPCSNWSVQVPTADLSTGMHMLDVRVTDAAGNDVVGTTPFDVTPVPEAASIPATIVAGAVLAVLAALVSAYLLVLRKGPGEGAPLEQEPETSTASGEGPALEPEPGADLEPEPEPGMESEHDTGPGPGAETGPEGSRPPRAGTE